MMKIKLIKWIAVLSLITVFAGCGETSSDEVSDVAPLIPIETTGNGSDDSDAAQEVLLTSFVIKESAQVGINNYPVSMVFPVEYGTYQNVEHFQIKTTDGAIVPAQFEVLNRWWGKDNSIRHVQAYFNTDIQAHQVSDATSGLTHYQLFAGENNVAPDNPIVMVNNQTELTLTNSLVKFNIQKSPLKITTPAGVLSSVFEKEDGSFENSFDHDEIEIEIEESGPVRTTVKIHSKTKYISADNIRHGWALRLYFYANSPLVKLDFQLQNSAVNAPLSAPLFFKSHKLNLSDVDNFSEKYVRADYIPEAEIGNLPYGQLATNNVNVILRNFWQTFPNGIQSNNGELNIELWPYWSKQFYDNAFVEPDIYWLDDMKQTYKEVLLDFSLSSSGNMNVNLAKTFQYPPVAVIPTSYYQQTKVTLDLGGVFPDTTVEPIESRLPQYRSSYYEIDGSEGYRFGMDNFGLDRRRKRATSMAGGWPESSRNFFMSGNPADYHNVQDFAVAEINIRPQWLTGYMYDEHQSAIKLTTNPYAGNTWRRFLGHGVPTIEREYIEGTKQTANPRDDQHAWFYHVEHAYLMSGNKWIKDWYEFMAEFKKVYLLEKDPWPDFSLRAEGHSLSVALAAYQMTGNPSLKEPLANYYIDIHSKYLLEPYFLKGKSSSENPKIAAFQAGYSLRALINIYNEFPANEALMNLARNYFEWNYQFGQFSYYKSIIDSVISDKASATSLTMVDPAIWFAMHTGDSKYAEHAVNYVQNGIGGVKPYGKWSTWQGQFESTLFCNYVQNQ